VAERRICSVLFVDLVGFTPLSESRDPEAVRELLSRYFERARTVIARYGGVVEKFIGDAVMAVWGAPIAAEGDAERAVRAAMDLIGAVEELGADAGAPDLRARAGVVTGEVAVTLGAVGEGMVAGDAVNTAARVQGVATPGTVFVDEATRRLASAGVGFVEVGEQTLKGKSAPFAVFQATRVLSVVGGAERIDGLEAPMVGRDAELRLKKELFHASAQRGTPRLVVVSGPAGVGKSRLGWEFEKYVDGLAETVWWHRGRCLSYGEGIAYWALAEMVRQRFGIAEEDSLDVAAAKLAERLPRVVADPAEQAVVGPRLARLLGTTYGSGDAGPLTKDELFAGWRLFIDRLADREPVLMLVEDGQHADPALLDFLEQLADQSHRGVYIVFFTRPELVDQRPGFGVGRNRTLLSLDPLDQQSMHEVFEALVPGMPADAVAAIEAHAQGIPLFAIETIRSLIDRDIVVAQGGHYRLVGDVGLLQVPDSLHGLLAARLDGLPPDLRALVADAAVLGTTFSVEALTAVSGRTPAEVVEALADLVRRDIFEVSADPLSPQRGAYVFRQNLLRQVAYDTLSRRDRKARHLAVAAHLTAVFDGEEIMEVVARHYRDALDAVPDDDDNAEIAMKAVQALERAAERQLSAGAPGRAAQDFADAAEVTRQFRLGAPTAAAELWLRAAVTARMVRHENIYNWAMASAEAFVECGDAHGEARAHVQAAVAFNYEGRVAEARALLTKSVDVLRPRADLETVHALRELAVLELFNGNTIGRDLSDEALVLAENLDAPESMLAHLFEVRGTGYALAGESVRAMAMLRHAVYLAERAGDRVTLGRILSNMCDAVLGRDPREAADYARKAYEVNEHVGGVFNASMDVGNYVTAELMIGRWTAAAEMIERWRAAYPVEGNFVEHATAMLAIMRGDVATAQVHSTLTFFRESEDPQTRGVAMLIDAALAYAERRPADAYRICRQMLDEVLNLGLSNHVMMMGFPLGMRAAFDVGDDDGVQALLDMLDGFADGQIPLLLRAERALAKAKLLARNDREEGHVALANAVTRVRETGCSMYIAHALLDMAQLGNPTAAERADLVREAEAIAAELDCQPLAERASAMSV
jgi:class 3 adenylate cyclase